MHMHTSHEQVFACGPFLYREPSVFGPASKFLSAGFNFPKQGDTPETQPPEDLGRENPGGDMDCGLTPCPRDRVQFSSGCFSKGLR